MGEEAWALSITLSAGTIIQSTSCLSSLDSIRWIDQRISFENVLIFVLRNVIANVLTFVFLVLKVSASLLVLLGMCS